MFYLCEISALWGLEPVYEVGPCNGNKEKITPEGGFKSLIASKEKLNLVSERFLIAKETKEVPYV